MASELTPASLVSRRRPLGVEICVVVIVALAVLIPGIWKYSLVDPWETHYGEVGRMMLQEHDFVHMQWPGGYTNPDENEGFRSKPVLTFWAMAAGLRAAGVAEDGGYSGEMTESGRTMVGIRLPFILFGTLGLTLLWWMLARLVSRRLAWIAMLVVLSCPFYALIARQGIPDMLLCSLVMGAIAMLTMALEDGDRPIDTAFELRVRKRKLVVDQRHLLFAITGAICLAQAVYYCVYFIVSPRIALLRFPNPAVVMPLLIVVLYGAMSREGWLILRLPFILIGGIISTAIGRPLPQSPAGRPWHRVIFEDYLEHWERDSLDRYIVRGLCFPIAWAMGHGWRTTDTWADHILALRPITTMRQVYLLWCYTFLGLSVLAKGPPGVAVVAAVGVLHVGLFGNWRGIWEGQFEIKRGLALSIAIFLPWHIGMWLKEGVRFIDEYLFTHILNRAAVGVDNSPGTFHFYTTQLGHGMWLWAALLPVAFGVGLLRARAETREARVRFLMVLWAICAIAVFTLVQTKFNHYILPAVPPLAVVVAFFLDDVWQGRSRLHPIYAGLAAGITLLICRDLMWEPERWIEMFVFRYDRPWPNAEPWSVDASDGFLVLGVIAVVAIVVAATRFRKAGVIALLGAGMAICIWALQAYMPVAGTHWGMREAVRTYYEQRNIYGEKRIYYGARQLYNDLHDAGDKWTFETFIPETLQIGQPMTITIQLNKAEDERLTSDTVEMIGKVTRIGDHDVEVTLNPGERAKLEPVLAKGKKSEAIGRPVRRIVDADKLVSWQLYWRGENFWSADEIFGPVPEMRTGFNAPDNQHFTKYFNDRTKAPLGRRYFIITEASRAMGARNILPTQRGRDSYEVLDTTSNKFSLAAFYL